MAALPSPSSRTTYGDMTLRYQCEICLNWFEREGGGRPPKSCPEHRGKRATRRTAEWQKANPEKTKRNRAATWSRYYPRHRKRLIAATVERNRLNPGPKRARDAARYARTRGAPESENFTLDEIFLRDEGVCHLCEESVERSDATMDHVHPVARGGSHTRDNVKLAHRSHNSSRKTMPVAEWRERHGYASTASRSGISATSK